MPTDGQKKEITRTNRGLRITTFFVYSAKVGRWIAYNIKKVLLTKPGNNTDQKGNSNPKGGWTDKYSDRIRDN